MDGGREVGRERRKEGKWREGYLQKHPQCLKADKYCGNRVLEDGRVERMT